MKVELEELVSGAEAARRLGLSRERIRQLAGQPGFPAPLGRVGQAIVWRWADVEAWARQRPSRARGQRQSGGELSWPTRAT